MPHLVIEFSRDAEHGVDVAALCQATHAVMTQSGIFPLAGIRVRAHKADFAVVADGHPDNDFVAMTLSVGAGRSTAELHAAGSAIFKAAQGALADRLSSPHFALSLEIRVINPELSWKDTPIHGRLSKRKQDFA
ncbi:MAG: 5-carboxymethyl-2-hydroxymuconate Delta-isomerase [Nitratireductor sp.]|nr:5-carboxymethyl-2-hydroxymuconate Delta-isomerase [Nitratireductor sp.]MCB1454827.1 5-carboxymethyl-2-hydroxymuconate Delta-isomerase [Nitratireductor sp.]MCB1458972.1 5-carboxymethyl-2-hydroxymuconate Delta-isomerase [Nitratireductor sp.]